MKRIAIGLQSRQGVTLAELGIVLVVTAVILGGLWATIDSSRKAAQIGLAVQQHVALMTGAKNFFKDRASANFGVGNALNLALADRGSFPAEMLRPGTAGANRVFDHVWGPVRPNNTPLADDGSGLGANGVVVFPLRTATLAAAPATPANTAPACNTTADCYFVGVHYRGIPVSACSELALKINTDANGFGVQNIYINHAQMTQVQLASPRAVITACRTNSPPPPPPAVAINPVDMGADLTVIYRLR